MHKSEEHEDSNSSFSDSEEMDYPDSDFDSEPNYDPDWAKERTNVDQKNVERIGKHKYVSRQKPPHQLKVLRAAYEKDPRPVFMDTPRAEKLMAQTGLSLHDVQSWFSNRRRLHSLSSVSNRVLGNIAHISEFQQSRAIVTKRLDVKTPEQLEVLQAAYEEDPTKPPKHSARMEQLVAATKLEYSKIQQWYACRGRVEKNRGRPLKNAEATKTDSDIKAVLLGKCRWKTPDQIKVLVAAFEEDSIPPDMKSARVKQLGEATGLAQIDIRVWFQDRMRNLKKRKNKDTSKDAVRAGKRPEQLQALIDAFEEDPNLSMKSERGKKLVESTGLSKADIHQWFRKSRKTVGAPEMQARRTPEEIKVFLEAYEKDPTMPTRKDGRLQQLCAVTGLSQHQVKNWFAIHRQKCGAPRCGNFRTPEELEILRAAFESDSTTPCKGSARMQRLCEATGLPWKKIQYWFTDFKRRGAGNSRKVKKEEPDQQIDADGMENDCTSTSSLSLDGLSQRLQEDSVTQKDFRVDSTDSNQSPCNLISPITKRQLSDQQNVKKCPVCGSVSSVPAVSISTVEDALKVDDHFGSFLVHFLPYTSAVKVCMTHMQEVETM